MKKFITKCFGIIFILPCVAHSEEIDYLKEISLVLEDATIEVGTVGTGQLLYVVGNGHSIDDPAAQIDGEDGFSPYIAYRSKYKFFDGSKNGYNYSVNYYDFEYDEQDLSNSSDIYVNTTILQFEVSLFHLSHNVLGSKYNFSSLDFGINMFDIKGRDIENTGDFSAPPISVDETFFPVSWGFKFEFFYESHFGWRFKWSKLKTDSDNNGYAYDFRNAAFEVFYSIPLGK